MNRDTTLGPGVDHPGWLAVWLRQVNVDSTRTIARAVRLENTRAVALGRALAQAQADRVRPRIGWRFR